MPLIRSQFIGMQCYFAKKVRASLWSNAGDEIVRILEVKVLLEPAFIELRVSSRVVEILGANTMQRLHGGGVTETSVSHSPGMEPP